MEPMHGLVDCPAEWHLLSLPLRSWQWQVTAVNWWRLCSFVHRTDHWKRRRK